MSVLSSSGMARFSQRATQDSRDVTRRNTHSIDMWNTQEFSEGVSSSQMTLRATVRPVADSLLDDSTRSDTTANRQGSAAQRSVSPRPSGRKDGARSAETQRSDRVPSENRKNKGNLIRRATAKVGRTIKRSPDLEAASDKKRSVSGPAEASNPTESAPGRPGSQSKRPKARREKPGSQSGSASTVADVELTGSARKESQHSSRSDRNYNDSTRARVENDKNPLGTTVLAQKSSVVAKLKRPLRRVFRREESNSPRKRADTDSSRQNIERAKAALSEGRPRKLGAQ